jgi:cation transport protein ChaC
MNSMVVFISLPPPAVKDVGRVNVLWFYFYRSLHVTLGQDFLLALPDGDIWIFGYGSLMWRPGFPHLDFQPALLRGYHRALCVYSVEYRGTFDCPGLVFGLDLGGSCRGRAMRVERGQATSVLEYLHEREMKHRVYLPKWLPVKIPTGTVQAYCFTVDRDHERHTGALADEVALKLIHQGYGKGGACLDYLQNTIQHLDELGITDGPLHRIVRLAEGSNP